MGNSVPNFDTHVGWALARQFATDMTCRAKAQPTKTPNALHGKKLQPLRTRNESRQATASNEIAVKKLNRRGAKGAEEGKLREIPAEMNQLTDAVIGAAIEVHRRLGPGFLESTYHRALEIELELRKVPFESEAQVVLDYKGRTVGEGRIDLRIDRQVVVELKAVEKLASIHQAQVISYLKATGHIIGLLINFNTQVLRDGIKRVVLS